MPPRVQYGTPAWFEQHDALEQLNLQAHLNAQSYSDEFVKEAVVLHDRVTVLVRELLMAEVGSQGGRLGWPRRQVLPTAWTEHGRGSVPRIPLKTLLATLICVHLHCLLLPAPLPGQQVWREQVLPLLEGHLAERVDSVTAYQLLYHEASLANLLEVPHSTVTLSSIQQPPRRTAPCQLLASLPHPPPPTHPPTHTHMHASCHAVLTANIIHPSIHPSILSTAPLRCCCTTGTRARQSVRRPWWSCATGALAPFTTWPPRHTSMPSTRVRALRWLARSGAGGSALLLPVGRLGWRCGSRRVGTSHRRRRLATPPALQILLRLRASAERSAAELVGQAPLAELRERAWEVRFGGAQCALAILRYITDHAPKLSLSVLARIVSGGQAGRPCWGWCRQQCRRCWWCSGRW